MHTWLCFLYVEFCAGQWQQGVGFSVVDGGMLARHRLV